MRRVLIGLAILLAAGVVILVLSRIPGSHTPPVNTPPGLEPGQAWFEDVSSKAGIAFKHFDPATTFHLVPETMGSGIGWIDYDADGWPDLFCVQDGPLPPAPGDPTQIHRLYRNNRDGTFSDVTERAGLTSSGFGCGCAVGDYDNDGFDDILVTYLGGIQLLHNQPDPRTPGGRRFVDVTAKSGLKNSQWGTSAAWGDLDNDGFLDLYVCNYVVIDPAKPLTCESPVKGVYFTCGPTMYAFASHLLFRNNGNGTFTDISLSSGIAKVPAPGLAVAILDLDADGKQDIFVANDMAPQFLFRNLGAMRFEEIGLMSGVALGPGGARVAGMGIEAADFSGSGRPDLFVTSFQKAPNVFFQNLGKMRYQDMSFQSGLGGPSMERLKFGACAIDANLDGNLDLGVANGHVHRSAATFGLAYAQPAQLFLGAGTGKFRDASDRAGADFLRPRVGRGLARADFDRDGLTDLAMSGVGEPIALLRNRTETPNRSVTLHLIGDGKKSNRNAIGAVVKAEWAGKVRHHFVLGGGTYLSANDWGIQVGIGEAERLDRVTVRWPSGHSQEFKNLPAKTSWRLREGVAEAEARR